MRALSTGVLRNLDLADEALQTAFGKAIEHGAVGRAGRIAQGSWLFRVAFNEALVLKR